MAGYLPDPTPPGAAPAPLAPMPKPPVPAPSPVIPPQVGRTPVKKFGKATAGKKPGLAGKLKGLGK
jgi:hypothetical protein